MFDSALLIVLVLSGGLLSSIVIDHFVTPQTERFWRRPLGSNVIHCGLWLIVFAIEFMQFQRLWVSAFLTATIQCVLVIINHAKYTVLREPFIYQDTQYLVDACRFPRLYIPFFGWGRLLVSVGLLIFGLLVVLRLERPMTEQFGFGLSVIFWLLILITGCLLIFIGSRSDLTLSFDPQKDIARYGFLTTLWLYFRAERQSTPVLANISSLAGDVDRPIINKAPHVIVVQSESFFDIRRWCPAVDSAILTNFDRTCAESLASGLMAVPAWGANTVRTEFSFLTGITPADLGIDRFNPYRRLVSRDTPSLARYYRQLGYHTIAIHPYFGAFYRRDQLFPELGFDRFIDINEFERPDDNQPYVGDVAVAQKVENLLCEHLRQGDPRPVFIFVITMENHGPLHLEKLPAVLNRRWLTAELPEVCSDIPIYLRHLANADAMIKRLTSALSVNQIRPGVLCVYGDHVPIMDRAYAALGSPDVCTDYFIWRSDCIPPVPRKPTPKSIDQLGRMLVDSSTVPLRGS